MEYRLYQPEDFAALYAIEELCFASPQRFDEVYMRELVANPDGITWIAEDAGGMAGFAIADWTEMRGQKLAYIQTLEVRAEDRRRGVGRELLHRLEDSARAAGCALIWLHVDVENGAAIKLYEAEGYARKGTRAEYYGAGRPAAVYSKMLDKR